MEKSFVNIFPTLLLVVALAVPAFATRMQQLGWEDLVKKVEFEDPFEALTQEQLYQLGTVARVRALQDRKSKTLSASMRKDAEEAETVLQTAGIDINGLLSRREEIKELRRQRAYAVVDDLDGQQVRMPGYALPLEFSNKKITEFLLVPWVGACIHTPPPPPNQIVFVQTAEGIDNHGQFTPVWVSGVMAVKAATKDLFLVDGSTGINVGYRLTEARVEPYKQ
jgi:hypothetical protein